MLIIAVFEEAFSGGKELAAALAKRLKLRYVDAGALVKRLVAEGGDREQLTSVLKSPPGLLDRFTHHGYSQILLLQKALAEEIREGNAVCYGAAADLLNLEADQILRIRVEGSHRFRLLQVQEQLSLHRDEADRRLLQNDRAQRRWRLYLFRIFRTKAELLYQRDLAINFEHVSLDEACTSILDVIADQSRFRPEAESRAPLERFAASTRIRAALANDPATSHLDIGVEVRDKSALLSGAVYCLPDAAAIQRVALSVAGGLTVDTSGLAFGSQGEAPILFSDPLAKPMPPSQRSFWTPAFSWSVGLLGFATVAIIAFALTPAGSRITTKWFAPGEAQVQTIAGVITDTHCAFSYKNGVSTADCVRSCVEQAGAKYALADGTHLYTLSDQLGAEPFAAQRVVATAVLEQGTGALRVRSIQAIAATP